MIVAKPNDPATALAGLVAGAAIAAAYEDWMDQAGLRLRRLTG